MSYRSVITMPCGVHGSHEITVRAEDDWAILLGLSNLKELREAGVPARISCYQNERLLTREQVTDILLQGADELCHPHEVPPD